MIKSLLLKQIAVVALGAATVAAGGGIALAALEDPPEPTVTEEVVVEDVPEQTEAPVVEETTETETETETETVDEVVADEAAEGDEIVDESDSDIPAQADDDGADDDEADGEPANHGAAVSQAAKDCPKDGDVNHGQCVREVARSDSGKKQGNKKDR